MIECSIIMSPVLYKPIVVQVLTVMYMHNIDIFIAGVFQEKFPCLLVQQILQRKIAEPALDSNY